MICIRPLGQYSLKFALLAGTLVSWGIAEEKDQAPDNRTAPLSAVESSTVGKQVAFLGIVAELIHPAVVTHLTSVNSSEQGVIVAMVSANSPADHAGVRIHDIVLAYDDQKLFTPEQLARLVVSDRPGRDVKLSLIHEGRPKELLVKLGVRSVDARMDVASERSPIHNSRPRVIQRNPHPDSGFLGWNEFESITIKRLGKDRFQVSVSHPDRTGQSQQHEYQGTRAEIRARIEADQELSVHERAHLLFGLGGHTARMTPHGGDQADF